MDSEQSIKNHEDVPPDYYETSIRTNLGQRYWHNARFKAVRSMIQLDRKATVLDIGSADGTFSRIILKKIKPKKYIGIDILKSSVEYSKKKFARNKNVRFKVGDAHKLVFKDNTFTHAFCLEVMEHIFKPDQVAREVFRVLKPGGVFLVLVPAETTLFRTVWWIWTKFKGRIWQHSHVQQFTHDSLKKLLKKNGFSLLEEKYFLFGMLYLIKVSKPA